MQKKIVLIVIGVLLVVIGFKGILSENTTGIGTLAGVGKNITYDSNPVEYVFMIIIELCMGMICIKEGLSKKNLDN